MHVYAKYKRECTPRAFLMTLLTNKFTNTIMDDRNLEPMPIIDTTFWHIIYPNNFALKFGNKIVNK